MTKKLTKQQNNRIATKCLKSIKNVNTAMVSAVFKKDFLIITKQKQILSARKKYNSPKLTVGDIINYYTNQQGETLITSKHLAKNTLITLFNNHKIKIASNINKMFITVALQPKPNLLLIDMYLYLAKINDIKPFIILNKTDLQNESPNYLQIVNNIYQKLAINIFSCSVINNFKQNWFTNNLDKNCLFCGQSGVGKSSIIKKLLPNEKIETRNLSDYKLGCHTTSSARLFNYNFKANIIDFPGVNKLIPFVDTKDNVILSFNDIHNFSKKCKFRNCTHTKEIGCCVIKALNNKELEISRFNSYLALLEIQQNYITRFFN